VGWQTEKLKDIQDGTMRSGCDRAFRRGTAMGRMGDRDESGDLKGQVGLGAIEKK